MTSIEPRDSAAERDRSQQSTSDVRQEIEAANRRFVEAFRRRDADAVAACYTSSAQLLPSNFDVIAGTEQITGFWRGAMDMGIADVRLETVEVEPRGDLAVEVGRYVLSGADGGPIDRGKYVVVWRREGGAWKLHRDIWTTSLPRQSA